MYSILDPIQFPWHEKAAQQLHLNLVQLFPAVADALQLVKQAGFNVFQINSAQAPYYLWIDILDYGARKGLLRPLVSEVAGVLHKAHPLLPFFEALLAGRPVTVESEPRKADGSPAFISGGDVITQPEALLYQDDLTIQTGRLPGLIKTLEKMIALAPAICKLEVNIHGESQVGTAFLLSEEWLLTNWHVLHRQQDEVAATAVTAIFGYEEDEKGATGTLKEISCLVESIITEKEDDWALIKVSRTMSAGWPVIPVNNPAEPVPHTPAYIIQHPLGNRKRLGFVRNQITAVDERIVHYLTDTQEGSSGAPVFSAEGILMALHHAGGRPQQMTGRAPMKKNEGIRISRILERLKNKGVALPFL